MKGSTRGGQPVRARCQSRQRNRLADRQAQHAQYPVSADGKEYNKSKPLAKFPGSLNPRKH